MAEFCKKCWLKLNPELCASDIVETKTNDFCEKCGAVGRVVGSVLPRPAKGVPYHCLMFEVRCKQECVSSGVRCTDKCPYDNYNSNSKKGVTPKGANQMADKKTTGGTPKSGGDFQPTFRKYKDMSESEQAAFRQGAKTSENKVKERLGFSKPKN